VSHSPSKIDALIGSARAGSKESLGELLEHYCPMLISKVSQYMDHHLSVKADGSDIVQETLFAAVQHFSAFNGSTDGEFTAWLIHILANQARDMRKKFHGGKRDIGREVPMTGAVMLTLETGNPADEKEDLEAKQEESQALRETLRRLPPAYRHVVTLHGKWEMTFKNVAHLMHRTIGAVKQLWKRSKKRVYKEVRLLRQKPKDL
jgi:RNA polymerase sigma-70 factor (subfamily 1)